MARSDTRSSTSSGRVLSRSDLGGRVSRDGARRMEHVDGAVH